MGKRSDKKTNPCIKFLKVLFIIVQILFLLVGLLITGYGVFMAIKAHTLPMVPIEIFYGFIALGSLITIMTILGIWAATSANTCISWTYIVFLLLIIGAQITALFMSNKFISAAESNISIKWDGLSEPVKNVIQDTQHCCGFKDKLDRPGSDCPADADSGCFEPVAKVIEAYKKYALYTIIGTGAFEGLLMVFVLVFWIYAFRKRRQMRRRVAAENGAVGSKANV